MAIRGLQRFRFGDFYGGLHGDFADDKIQKNAFTRSENFVLRKLGPEKAKGWEKFTDQLLTDGTDESDSATALEVRWIDEYAKKDGSNVLICMTDQRPYYFDETADLWIPFYMPDYGVSTTVDADSNSGQKVVNVTNTSGFSVNDAVIIHRNGTREEIGIIDSIAGGASGTLTLVDNLTNTHTAAQADSVEKVADSLTAASAANDTTIDVPDGSIYSADEAVLVGWGTGDQEYMVVDSISSNELTVSRPSWVTSGTGLQAAKAQYDLVLRVADCTFAASEQFDADINNDNYFFLSDALEVQKYTHSTITAGTTASAIRLCGDAERGDISSNTALRNCEDLGTSLCRAKFIRTFEGFLVLGHVVEGGTTVPQKIRWSRYLDTVNWENNADGSGQAGYFTFDGADFIMGLHQLKREMLVYRERSIEGMSYIGYPNIFGFRRAETGTGLIAPRALVDMGDSHIFCGPDNIWEYDGVSLRAIGDPIRNDFFDDLDPSQRQNVKMHYIEEQDEVVLSYSSTGDDVHDLAYCYNVILNQWSGPRDIDALSYGWYDRQSTVTWNTAAGTWDSYAGNWDSRLYRANNPLNMMGNDDGYVFILDEVGTKDGSALTGIFETKLTDCEIPHMNKRLLKVRVGVREEGDYTHDVYVGAADYEGENLTWHGPYTVGADSGDHPWVPVDVRGRLFKVRVQTTVNFGNIRDIELFFRPGGWM